MRLALRTWLDGDDGERAGERIAELIIGRAMSGHFGYFKLVLDLVDGKLHKTAEEELTFETDCFIALDARTESSISKAA
jgi:hypothetical protein